VDSQQLDAAEIRVLDFEFGPKSEPKTVEEHHNPDIPLFCRFDDTGKLVPIEPLPAKVVIPQPRARARGTRRLGCGRPAARRTSTRSRDGPSDLDEPPRSPAALEGVRG
jgi:hypothetical protein